MSDWSASSWIDRRDLKRLQPSAPTYAASPSSTANASADGIAVEGDAAFVAATQRALGLLAGIGQSPTNIRTIKQCDTGWPVGGWCFRDEARVEFEPSVSQGDARFYASAIAHENEHAGGVDGSGSGESHCLTVQANVLRRLGSSQADEIEAMARNPTPFHMR